MSGLPGTGKSAVADRIGRARRLPVLSVDPVESAMVRAGIEQGHATGLAAYLVVETLADACLAVGLAPVVDAVNAVDIARDMWRHLATKHGAPLVIIECIASDAAIQAWRLATRERGLALEEPTWDAVQTRRAEWAPWREERLTLDAVDPLDDNVERVLAYLDARSARSA